MTLGEFQRLLEEWIPPATAWKGDNVGVQIGRKESEITNILLALDVTREVAREAVERRANLIITHHPLLFHPLRSLTEKTRAGEIALYLAEHTVNLYAAHTNLDHVRGGVSFIMASLLGLHDVRVLSYLAETFVKVAVFVPPSHLEKIAKAMHDAGGGRFTNYQECSFRSQGVGTFKGMEGAKPFIGSKGVLERTPEIKLEMPVESWNLGATISAMLNAHPYEEVAYDIYPLQNENKEYGLGAIGDLSKPIPREKLLSLAKKAFGTPSLRYAGKQKGTVKKIAVCGGAGGELVSEAIRRHADALITSDVKYHTFQEAEREILLIDAGHFETEQHVLPVLAQRVKTIVKKQKALSKVFITKKNTNPISYY
ncbi:MAG: Nif3-like dinuclear metal center hexameric protein [Bacteroidota bacterium]